MSRRPDESSAEYERRCIAMSDEEYAQELRELLEGVEPVARACEGWNRVFRIVDAIQSDPKEGPG